MAAIQKVRLVLLGGGHTNTQVIKHIRKSDFVHHENVDLILISEYNTSLYSGMCPGGVSAQYQVREFSIDLSACCKKLGWTFICKQITEIDDTKNMLIATDGTQIKYDLLSIDIGSTNVGLNTYEGIKQYAISTRPLTLLMHKVNNKEMYILNKIKTQSTENGNKHQDITINIITIGGGCAGCELTMCLMHRLNRNIKQFISENKLNVTVDIKATIITNSEQILKQDPKALQLSVLKTLKSKHIHIITKHCVTKIDKDSVYLSQNGKERAMKYDIAIWSTGAAAHDIKTTNITRDDKGWFKVNKYLQSVSNPNIFGAGDCVNIIDYCHNGNFPPKSGVYAVRAGPILIHNLKQYLKSADDVNTDTFKEYLPQTVFLRLLNTGDGKAIGCKHGISFQGAWVWKLKDWIDVSWMNKFNINNLLKEDSKHFKPKITEISDEEEQKQDAYDNKPIANAVKVLLINDEPNKCHGFASQWKTLLEMNDNKEFCDGVVKLFNESA